MITTMHSEAATVASAEKLRQRSPREGDLRDCVEAAYRRARASVFDVRPHDQQGPLEHSQQDALDDFQAAESSLTLFRRRPI